MADKSEWIWMPHPAHFIGAWMCRFRLATCVGNYIVSTVGEFEPNGLSEKADYKDIGIDSKYETIVFKSTESDHACCPKKITPEEIDDRFYNDPGSAYKGHLELCEKYSKL